MGINKIRKQFTNLTDSTKWEEADFDWDDDRAWEDFLTYGQPGGTNPGTNKTRN